MRGMFDFLISFREMLVERLMDVFSEPYSSLAAALLFGVRTDIPYDIKDAFKRTGLTHVLALSGFNISILIQSMAGMFSFLPRRIRGSVTIGMIFLFTIMVGAQASIVRAAIMGSIAVVAEIIGRPYDAKRALFVSALVMVVISPEILTDIGFQLSFGATAGIIIHAKKVEAKWCQWIPEKFGLRGNMSTTMAAYVWTLPIILWHFDGISLISPLVNLAVLPLVPYLMLGSFLSLFFGFLTAIPTTFVFKLMLWIITTTAQTGIGYVIIN